MSSYIKYPVVFLASILIYANGYSQSVNGYARVAAISGTTLTVSNVDESGDSFVAGEKAIIMQMQDDVIGSTTDDATFGNLGSTQSAGLYEVVTLSNVNIGGNTIEVSSLSNTYNTGANSRVQIITYPDLGGGGDFTTTSDIFARAWNGDIGGIVAFRVAGTLTLSHNIIADGRGFRGGAINNDNNSAGCNSNLYRTNTQDGYADKGEGIYLDTDTDYTAGRGRILNGGGGGNSHNAGGGGGSNYSVGGQGGPGWQGPAPGYCDPGAGGLGGLALASEVASSRIFMGGGGGSGEGNQDDATAGADGGGIILISANTLTTTCGSSLRISANGENANATGGGDGAGGAGGAGSIILNIANFTVSGSCPLSVSANGGDGGNVNHGDAHGGGGGGGFGVVYYSSVQPTTNVNTETDPGNGGENSNSGSGGLANSGGGVSGAGGGVIDNTNSPLPVELLAFSAYHDGDYNLLKWKTATEINNDYFEIQLSQDGNTFSTIGTVDGSGTTKKVEQYQFKHLNQFFGTIYYRLKQVDYDGAFEYSKVIYLDRKDFNEPFKANLFPNPTYNNNVNLQVISDQSEEISVNVFDALGKRVNQFYISPEIQNNTLNLRDIGLVKGIYVLHLAQGDHELVKKLVVR